MAEWEFVRRGSSIIYRRRTTDGRQALYMGALTHSAMCPLGVRFWPQAEFSLPAVNNLVEKIVGIEAIPAATKFTERIHVEHFSHSPRWVAETDDALHNVIAGPLKGVIETLVLPMFDQTQTIASFAAMPGDEARK